MFTQDLLITWPDGLRTVDTAIGNTRVSLRAAVASLTRSYELDGASVEAR